MTDAPCKVCGYNGPGFYSSVQHPCPGNKNHVATAQPVDTEGLVEAVARAMCAADGTEECGCGATCQSAFNPKGMFAHYARAAISALPPRMDDVRREALEEAAKVAEEYRDPCLDDERDVNVAAASARACVDITAAIRSLSGSEGCD